MITHRLYKGICYMLLSATGLSVSILFVKLASPFFSFYQLAFLRFLIPLLILIPFVTQAKSRYLILKTSRIKAYFLRALLVAVGQLSIFYYISRSSVLNAIVLLNTGPLFIPILTWIFLKHPLRISTIISILISFSGVLLILGPDQGLFTLLSFAGLLAGFCNGASQVVYGYNVSEEANIVSLFYLYFFTTFLTLFPFLFYVTSTGFDKLELSMISYQGLPMFYVFMTAIMSLGNQIFRGMSYKMGKPGTMAVFLYLSVVLAGLWDWLFLGVVQSVSTIIGALLVIFGGTLKGIMIYIHLKKHHSKSSLK